MSAHIATFDVVCPECKAHLTLPDLIETDKDGKVTGRRLFDYEWNFVHSRNGGHFLLRDGHNIADDEA